MKKGKKIVGTCSLEEAFERFASKSKENKRTLEMAKDFHELSKVAENFINKWGCPHSAIIIRQGEIEFFEGVCGSPLKLLD